MLMSEVDALVRRVRGGEVEVFAELIRRYEQPVWRVVAAMLQSIDESRELLQQVFVDAYLNLDQFRLGEDFGLWIKAIARNCVRKELRRLARESKRLHVYRERLLQRLQDDMASERHTQAYLEALSACREQLPERSADVLDRRYGQGKTFEQIAQELEVTQAAVEKLLSRVRLALRDCIQLRLAQT
jgi:RNA polymerase sigma-70 factor (ECF subfamily)